MAYSEGKDRRNKDYKKPPACLLCKHYYICDGIENEVKDFKPIPEGGGKIVDVNYYREGFYE